MRGQACACAKGGGGVTWVHGGLRWHGVYPPQVHDRQRDVVRLPHQLLPPFVRVRSLQDLHHRVHEAPQGRQRRLAGVLHRLEQIHVAPAERRRCLSGHGSSSRARPRCTPVVDTPRAWGGRGCNAGVTGSMEPPSRLPPQPPPPAGLTGKGARLTWPVMSHHEIQPRTPRKFLLWLTPASKIVGMLNLAVCA